MRRIVRTPMLRTQLRSRPRPLYLRICAPSPTNSMIQICCSASSITAGVAPVRASARRRSGASSDRAIAIASGFPVLHATASTRSIGMRSAASPAATFSASTRAYNSSAISRRGHARRASARCAAATESRSIPSTCTISRDRDATNVGDSLRASDMHARWLTLLLLGCNNPHPAAVVDAGGPPADAPPAVILVGTPILATAQLGTGDALLGTTVDATFAQINGDAIFGA